MLRKITIAQVILLLTSASVYAGPYTEAGVNGYIGSDRRHANPTDDDAVINPIFRGWATDFKDYLPSDELWYGPGIWDDPNKALGPATGNVGDIVSLGDLDADEIAQGKRTGRITLIFGDPCDPNDPNHIRDVKGYDFVVFENGLISNTTDPYYGIVAGDIFAELGYVEVSSNGIDFARFPCVSLTAERVLPGGTVDITNIFNLAGKYPNGYGWCIGTAFDLSDIADDPNVISGTVDINSISYVRIVDIPGSGDFLDQARDENYIAPCSWPDWACYANNHPIYDGWVTEGSGGFDLEAIGVLEEQEYSADINIDGVVDTYDLSTLTLCWLSHFGRDNWVGRCDLAEPQDLTVDFLDFAVFADQWRKVEAWRW